MIENDGIFNAEGSLWTSLVDLSIRLNVKLDQTAQGFVQLSYEYLQRWRFPFLWAPVPMTDLSPLWRTFLDASLVFAEVAVCVHCPISFHSVSLGKKSLSIFLISSHYTAENSNKFPPHTLLQPSLLQAKQMHLSASPCTFVCTGPLAILMPFCWVCASLVLGSPKPRHSTPRVV